MITKILSGHISPETAYVIDDYPYGYTLRCKMRHWIETTKNGQRLVSQTTNPKREGEFWNTPKKSTYTNLKVMYLNEDNHVKTHSLTVAYDAEKIEEYVAEFGEALTSDYCQKVIKACRFVKKTREEMAVLVLKATDGKSSNIYDTPQGEKAYILAEAKARALKALEA